MNRTELNNPVLCQRIGSNFPKLYDFEKGPENGLSSPATDVAYILNDTTPGTSERWIKFNFLRPLPLTHVTLYYYCTGTPPQLQLSEDQLMTSPKTPLCGDAVRQQCLSFEIGHATSNVVLHVKRNGGQFYLTEVDFVLGSGNKTYYIHL